MILTKRERHKRDNATATKKAQQQHQEASECQWTLADLPRIRAIDVTALLLRRFFLSFSIKLLQQLTCFTSTFQKTWLWMPISDTLLTWSITVAFIRIVPNLVSQGTHIMPIICIDCASKQCWQKKKLFYSFLLSFGWCFHLQLPESKQKPELKWNERKKSSKQHVSNDKMSFV